MFAAIYFLESTLAGLTLWMWLIATISAAVQDPKDPQRYALNYTSLCWIIVVLGLYVYLFGSMQARFGGGAPTPVTLYLGKAIAWLPEGSASVSLIDETDQGYVLTVGRQKALFVPRADVESVYFENVDTNQKPK